MRIQLICEKSISLFARIENPRFNIEISICTNKHLRFRPSNNNHYRFFFIHERKGCSNQHPRVEFLFQTHSDVQSLIASLSFNF